MKLLTVVVCCYNSSNTIKNTLDSIDIEHNKDVDVLIINDGSKDNLEQVINPYLTKFPDNFHYIKKENGNWGSCINLAISKANSRYISILDSDDTYDIPAFNYVMNELRRIDADTDLVLCNYVWKFLNKKKHNIKEINFSTTSRQHEYVPIDRLDLFHVITIHSAIFRLDLLKQTKPLPEKTYYSDGVLIYQALMLTKKICHMNESVHWYNYCIRTGADQSISAEKTVKNYHNLEVVFDAFLHAPFPSHPTKKQIQIARKFICNHFYWFFFALSKNYNYTHKEKIILLKQYYQKLITFENEYDVKLRTKLAKFFNAFKGPLLPIINFVTQYLPISFLKASRYTKEQKKRAKAEAKARRQTI